MKKITAALIGLMILLIFPAGAHASSQIDADMVNSVSEIKAGQEITLTLKFDNYEEINKGINAYKATLLYDHAIFEEVTLSSFKQLNQWENLQYNDRTGEFVAIKKAGSKSPEENVQITLKAKENAKPGKTTVKITDIVTSEGKVDIPIDEAKENIHIIRVQQGTPEDPENPAVTPEDPENPAVTPEDPENPDTNSGDGNNTNRPASTNPPKTGERYAGLFIFIALEALIVSAILIKTKDKKFQKEVNKKGRRVAVILVTGVLAVQLIGAVGFAASDFAAKGEVNGDGEINYSDVTLLERHLVGLEMIAEDYTENADMNSDGKLTVTDLTLLIQKIEKTLDYEVELSSIETEDYCPDRDQEITIKFSGEVSYGAVIEKVKISGREYKAEKINEATNEYLVKVNTGSEAGIKDYHFTEVTLDNGKKIKTDNTLTIDVLKEMPAIQNYTAEEDIDNSIVNLSFEIADPDKAITSAQMIIFDAEGNTIKNEAVKTGENEIPVNVEDGKNYIVKFILDYNLTTGQLTQPDTDRKGFIEEEKELRFVIDYQFEITDIKAYKDNEEATAFEKNQPIQIGFESTNATKFEPAKIKVDGKEYDVTKRDNLYVATIDPVSEVCEKELTLEEITLSNGKKLPINQDNKITVNIIKQKPTLTDFTAEENTETKKMKVGFTLNDEDRAVQNVTIALLDSEGSEIQTREIQGEDIQDGKVSEMLDTKLTSSYKVKVTVNYNQTGEGGSVNSLSLEEVIKAKPVTNIKKVTTDIDYAEKGQDVTVTYEVESNKEEAIARIRVNDVEYLAQEISNEKYSITFSAGQTGGIEELRATKVIYEDETMSDVSNTVKIDVLKDKPHVENFEQQDDLNNSQVTLNFDLKDEENSFVSGTAALIRQDDGTVQEEAELQVGENSLCFRVEEEKLYTLAIKVTFDRDSNTLEGKDPADNLVTDETIETMTVELLPNYQLEVTNVRTYRDSTQTSYFEKGQGITVKFNSTNVSQFVPEKAVINGKEYPLTADGSGYAAQVDAYTTSGVKDIVIEKIILNNTKELAVTENNRVQAEVLKDKPTAADFSFDTTDSRQITARFNLIDEEDALMAGNILILDENGEKVKDAPVKSGENEITFEIGTSEVYTVKALIDYDLDTDHFEPGKNDYQDENVLEEVIFVNNRMIEMKDIKNVYLYKQNGTRVERITNVNIDDLNNPEDYLVKVEMQDLPAFYSKIKEYKADGDTLKFILDYDNAVQYNGTEKHNYIEVEYGQIEGNTAAQTDLAGLIEKISSNPSGNYTITTDLDAANITEGQAVILQEFSGTLNGNGHTIKNLSRPLFSSLNGATVKNLVIRDASVKAYGALAPTMSGTTVTNVHLKNVKVAAPGANGTGSFAGIATSNTLIENCSATDVTVGTAKRTGGLIGKMTDTTVRNCYISGTVSSNSDGSGGLIGEALSGSAIENCYVNVTTNFGGTGGSIGGVIGNPENALLKNTLSVATSISGDGHGARMFGRYRRDISTASANNYELATSNLNGNSSHQAVSEVSESALRTKAFYKDTLKWDETLWNFDNVEKGEYPTLKNADPNNSVEERPANAKLFIPEYSRLKKLPEYDETREIAYHNLYKLMPFYDAKYLIQDGNKISSTDDLNTKLIKAVVPLDSENQMIVGLTDKTTHNIAKIKIVFEDESTQEHLLTYEDTKSNIANYELKDLKIGYNYPKYLIKEDSQLITALTDLIGSYTFEENLNGITSEDEDKRYKENFDNIVRENPREFVINLLANVPEYNISIESELLENKVKQDLEENNQLEKLLVAYNYFDRMYKIDIGGVTVRDALFFDGSSFGGELNPIQATNQFMLSPYRATNQSVNYYNNSIQPYTGEASIADFLEYYIKNFAGYEDVTRWFPENYQGFVYEAPAKDFGTEIEYRAWNLMKRRQEIILATLTMPSDQMYVLAIPSQLLVGSIRIYKDDVDNPAVRNEFQGWLENYGDILGEYYNVMAKLVPNGENLISRKMQIHYDKRAIKGGIYQDPNTTDDPFVKHFYGMIKRQSQLNGSAAYANGTDVYWVANTVFFTTGVGNTGTFTHETAHNQDGYFYLLGNGRRPGAGAECFTDSVICQRMNIETVHFNALYNHDFTADISNNLTTERIDSTEKAEDFYKKMWEAVNTIDYIEAQAFLQCSPEVQSKIAKKYVFGTTDPEAAKGAKSLTAEEFRAMNLQTVEDLWNNQICIRVGATLNGDSLDNVYWYLPHKDDGVPEAKCFKRNAFEMLSVGGYTGGFVQYMSGASRNDLDAIQKITKDDTMTWKKYQMNKYETVSQKIDSTSYFDTEEMIQMFKETMEEDAQMGTSVTNTRMLRRHLYLYLQRATNDFRTGIYDEKQVVHISSGAEFVENIKQNPHGKYVLDADIDLTGNTGNSSITDVNFVGELDGNGHTISGVQMPIFNMVKFSKVRDLRIDDVSILGASGGEQAAALARTASYSDLQNIHIVSGEIEGTNYAAGMAGKVSGSFIKGCTANVIIRATGNYAGGLIGDASTSTITDSYTLGQVKGRQATGGFVGGGTNSYIGNCYSNCTVESTSANSSGGFIGQIKDNTTNVRNNIAFGRTKNAYKFDGMSAANMFGTNYQNNYEYEESVGASTLNKAGIDFTGKITSVSTAAIGSPDFYKNNLQWNADIWDFTNVEAGGLPKLKNLDSNNVVSTIEKTDISSVEEFMKIQDAPDGIYNITADIDFSDYRGGNTVITAVFTGKINGNGHTLSNLNNATLFNNFSGIAENLNIRDFTNTRNVDYVTAFANTTNMATLKNIKFENITLQGTHRTAVVSGTDNSSTFEQISVKNANVKGSGFYVSTFIGRKYGGKVTNCYVEGNLECYTTECGGLIGALQSGGQVSNVIANVNINRPRSTDSRNNNGGLIGNIYNNPTITNSISLGNMTGFTDGSGNEINVPKFAGCAESSIINYFQNCYEVLEATGTSRVTENTGDHLKAASRNDLNGSFYTDTLHFDDAIWDFTNISTTGHPELK